MDVVQTCLTVFSSIFPGCKEETAISLSLVTVCLAVVISLPGILGGSVLSPLSSVSSHWTWLEALCCSCWWGVTLLVLCLWSIMLWVTPWRCWAQAASSFLWAWESAAPTGEAVFFTDQSPRPLSPWGQAWLLLEWGNQPVHLVGRSCLGSQEGFDWLGSQTLWVNLRAGCPGAQSSATLGWQFLPSYMSSYLPFLHQVCSFPCSRELQLWCLTLDFTAATFHLYCSVLTVCSCQRFAAKNAVESETLPSCIFLYCSLENTIWVINNR